jgi:hypothetical protein
VRRSRRCGCNKRPGRPDRDGLWLAACARSAPGPPAAVARNADNRRFRTQSVYLRLRSRDPGFLNADLAGCSACYLNGPTTRKAAFKPAGRNPRTSRSSTHSQGFRPCDAAYAGFLASTLMPLSTTSKLTTSRFSAAHHSCTSSEV